MARNQTRDYSVFLVEDDRLEFAQQVNAGRADAAAQQVAQQLVDGNGAPTGQLTLAVIPSRNVQRFDVTVETKPRARVLRGSAA